MLRVTRLVAAAAAGAGAGATDATRTQVVSTKYVRRPQQAAVLQRQRRARARRAERVAMLHAKTHATAATLLQHDAAATSARDVAMAQLADSIFSKGHWFMGCATNIAHVPEGNPAMPLVALAGRERVGKSALLRSLFRASHVVSRANRQLRRDAMNYFNVGDVFNVVDLPGYGGTSVPWSTVLQHAVLLRNFARCQPSLKMLYYCMDVHFRHGVYVQDLDLLRFLASEVPNFTIVLTKAEQLHDTALKTRATAPTTTSSSHTSLADVRKELLYHDIHHPVLVTSAHRMGGIDTLRYDMVMNCLHALPTERLTYTEARRLSERLFTLDELRTVRDVPTLPTPLDDELQVWHAELAAEREAQAQQHEQQQQQQQQQQQMTAANNDDHKDGASTALATVEATTTATTTAATTATTSKHDVAYARLCKKAGNAALLRYVRHTSPWRNPLTWPAHVVPTRHPKANVMRCPGDAHNPYLTQPRFVVPRADMLFRRPNVGVRRYARKGRYEAEAALSKLLKPYTVPYFPDIVDVDMHPAPWTFLGSREAFYERSGGRQLGVQLLCHATHGQVHALSRAPAAGDADLARELRALEARAGSSSSSNVALTSGDNDDDSGTTALTTAPASIGMLRPPSDDEGDDDDTTAHTAR